MKRPHFSAAMLSVIVLSVVVCTWFSLHIHAPLCTIEAHPLYVAALEYSPDGRWLLSAGTIDQSVKLWNSQTGELAYLLKPKAGVTCATFAPDSLTVAIGLKCNEVVLWNLRSSSSRVLFHHPDDGVTSLAISRDGVKLVCGGCRGTIALCYLNDKLPLQSWSVGDAEVRTLAFRPSGEELIAGTDDGRILLFSLHDEHLHEPRLVAKIGMPVQRVSISTNGDFLAVEADSPDQGLLQMFDMRSLTRLWSIDGSVCPSGITSPVFSPTNLLLACGSEHDHPTIRLLHPRDGRCLVSLKSRLCAGHLTGITKVCFGPDGTLLASGDISGRVCIWSLRSIQE